MGIFGLGKKSEDETKGSCCCSASYAPEEMKAAEECKCSGGIKVLGGGCAKCHELEANTKAALEELGIQAKVELITDYAVIATYGVMSTPALVIDNKVVSYGKVLKKDEIIKLYKDTKD